MDDFDVSDETELLLLALDKLDMVPLASHGGARKYLAEFFESGAYKCVTAGQVRARIIDADTIPATDALAAFLATEAVNRCVAG